MRTVLLLVAVGLAAGPAQAAGKRPTLQLCKDGLALGETRIACPERWPHNLYRLRHHLPRLERVLAPLDRGGCAPAGPALEALLEPVAPLPVEVEAARVEARVLRAWQRAWRDQEAVAAGLGAFLLLGQGAQWLSVEPGDAADLAEDLRVLARRAKPAGPDAEVLQLPSLLGPGAEELRAQAERAARAFADGHARQRAAALAELTQKREALDQELLGQAVGLAQAAGDLVGGAEALGHLAEVEGRLARERRPAAEHARLAASLAERRAALEKRLQDALGLLGQLASDRLATQQELARAQAETRVLSGPGGRVLLHPAEPAPKATEPREVVMLALAEGGDPLKDGLSLVLALPVEAQPEKPGKRPLARPRPPRSTKLKLEEEGVERSAPGLRPADGHEPPPADAAVATRASHEQACSLGSASACYQAGLLWEAGSGGPQAVSTARRRFQQACDGDFELGCYQLGTYFMAGLGGEQNRILGRALLKRACQAGIQQACRRLELQ